MSFEDSHVQKRWNLREISNAQIPSPPSPKLRNIPRPCTLCRSLSALDICPYDTAISDNVSPWGPGLGGEIIRHLDSEDPNNVPHRFFRKVYPCHD